MSYIFNWLAQVSIQICLIIFDVRRSFLPATLALSLDLVTKFQNTIIFGTSDTILAQHFLGIQQNQCFALFERRRLCDDSVPLRVSYDPRTHFLNALVDIFAVLNCSVSALNALFCSGLLNGAYIIYIHYSDTLYNNE